MFSKNTRATILAIAFAASSLPAFAQALASDGSHDVLVLPDLQFAIRYNNKTFVPVRAKALETGESGIYLERPVEKALEIAEDFSKMNQNGGERLIIECYDPGKIGTLSTNRFNKEFVKQNKVKEINMTYDRVAKECGVPKETLTLIKAVKTFEILPKDGSAPYNLFAFQHGNHLTMFARRMRPGAKGFDDSPPNIIPELSLSPTSDTRGNVTIN
ncbi:MAG: hypothetical protein IPM23_22870 [Candidatus Melainabacteria bacterium]|nr:hypothetical protein [Candidatus Melainabacteria bacterium]